MHATARLKALQSRTYRRTVAAIFLAILCTLGLANEAHA